MEIGWIEHRGKRIFLVDYRGILMEKDMIAMLKRVYPYLENEQKGSKLLSLTDMTGCYATSGFLEEARKLERALVDHFIVKRAILGITGPKVILLKGFNLFAKNKLTPFDSREAALEYLARE